MHPKHFEYNPKIIEQVNNNIAPLSNKKTVNRAANPTKAILTQFCEKKKKEKKQVYFSNYIKNLSELFIRDFCTQFDHFF